MARINIEDCWWTDPRREKLGALLGSMLMADAVIIRAWRVAQEFWGKNRALVPKDVFATLQDSSKLIQAHLAEERENGFYVRGSSQYLEWIIDQREKASAGGKKSAQRPRDSKGRLLKKSKQRSNDGPSSSKPIQVSGSGSNSGSNSGSSSDKLAISEKSPAKINPISFYCDLWKSKNGVSPDIRGREAGQINKLAEDLGIDRTCQIMRAYFSMPDALFIKRGYDVGTMLLNLNAIKQFEANGKIVTKEMVTQIEKRVDKLQNTKQRRSIEELEREREAMLTDSQPKIAIGGKS